MSSGPYPSQAELHELFGNLSTDGAAFFDRVSDDVDWTVMGTHPCAGRYTSKADFQKATFKRLADIMKPPGPVLQVRNIIGGGDSAWVVAELILHAECNNGLKFDNGYAWCCRFDESGKIVEVRAYLDSWLVNEAVITNEVPSNRAPLPWL